MEKATFIPAVAGAGKTTFLIKKAVKNKNTEILIATYTRENEVEIKKKFYELNNFIPANVTIQTWFSFLLKHGVKPYQPLIYEGKINGMMLVNKTSGIKHELPGKYPIYYKEDDIENHYFNSKGQIYSDKISKFIIKANKKSKGAVIDRISNIYNYVYIDEVQDLAGYDLEIIKLLLKSKSTVLLVGDPRQVTYQTHHARKYRKYTDGKIKEFIENEGCKEYCDVDEELLKNSYRCNSEICNFVSKLYPDLEALNSRQEIKSSEIDHTGLFLVDKQDLNDYLFKYKPLQLRHSKTIKVNENFKVMNFGDSKGKTVDRVIIYPTEPMKEWLKGNTKKLKGQSLSKFYVALTRARYSVGIVYDKEKDIFEREELQEYVNI